MATDLVHHVTRAWQVHSQQQYRPPAPTARMGRFPTPVQPQHALHVREEALPIQLVRQHVTCAYLVHMQQQQTVLHVFNVQMVTFLMPQECRFVGCVHLATILTNLAKQHAEPVIQGHIATSLQPARVLPVQMARLQT